MESPITMGEAGDNVCKDKTEHTNDGVCVNGNLDCEDSMEVCEDSKAPEVNINNIESLKKVPENKVPTTTVDTDNEEAMDVDENEEIESLKLDAEDVNKDIDDHDSISESVHSNHSKLEDVENTINGTNSNDSAERIPQKNERKSESSDLNDSGDVVLVENDSEHKENGDVFSSSDVEEVINISDKEANTSSDIINLVSPAKKKKKFEITSYPPRRSSRNLNKQKSYVEKEDDEEEEVKPVPVEDEPDVEEVTPIDPLADPIGEVKQAPKRSSTKSAQNSATIVVSDTKRLVEIAANSKSSTSGKKEPTLVIIDTNSILSGRGPVPVSVSQKPSPIPGSFSMMPVALPAQGVYPPNMRATITPIPMSTPTSSKPSVTVTPSAPAPPPPAPAPILPTLTDDMYVVEAPSFIVPYVYEKPPIKPFREFVSKIQKDIEEHKKLEAELKKKEIEAELKKKEIESEEKKESEAEKEKDNEDKEQSEKSDDEDDDSDKTKNKSDKVEENEAEKKEDKKEDSVTISSKEETSKDLNEITDDSSKPKSNSYFDNALGQFFINIGYGLVQEFVQTDLLKQQRRKASREGAATAPETKMAISSLIKNLEYTKENNEPYRMEQKRCEYCSFKSESMLVMANHLETPHMKNYVYKCNFCTVEVRSPHDILFHMEAEHNTRGRLERAPAFHQCPNCPFEDNQKGKLSRHLVTCVKKFKPDRNLEPPVDWEPPAKIPRVPRVKQTGLSAQAATYQALAQAKGNYQLFSKLQQASSPQSFPRGRGRPSLMGKSNSVRQQTPMLRNANMMYRPGGAGGSVLVPTSYFGGNQLFQMMSGQSDLGGRLSVSGPGVPSPAPVAHANPQSTVTIQNSSGTKSSSGKVVQQPSISITPLPRQPASASTTITKSSGGSSTSSAAGDPSSSKATFVICEICDGYIKDLEQLRNHMQWIHKVKIHPKMIYNRPPLNCQKCQFRFFTDQGLERHLLGSHGLVTSSMQEAANKSKDAGRCPVCGRVYQWKLLNHVARDHNMTLKPAHLSYKCTVCTATFGMYKQFENHVYSAHSVVAKRVMEKKGSPSSSSPSSSITSATISSKTGDSLLKPLKINDEITIIPQPAKNAKTTRASVK